ncbi:MAG: CDP-alcohol phosphatidyltransferase family protein [Oscillospiraceae bacterium]|jgi:cardiolipin synthase|nr:CDP-alcohol phosphatidyltransferase family protein [Oscillospiraceae bacterium]
MNKKQSLRKQALSIPNILSYFRILLIPVCAVLYLRGRTFPALAVLVLSGLTDIADGKIARRCGMVTDLGKVLDPVADKLTQGVLIFCVAGKTPLIALLAGILVVKEAVMIASGYKLYKKAGVVNSSRWYGKLCTILVYSTLVVHIAFPELPPVVTHIAVIVCGSMMIVSFVLYNIRFFRQLRLRSADGEPEDDVSP